MTLVRCDKGHFYDKDVNGEQCPYCAQLEKPAPSAAPETPQPQPAAAEKAPAPAAAEAPAVRPLPEDEEDNCTVGYYSRVIGVEPVVGWLVCIEGEYRGESFKLKSGRNFIAVRPTWTWC